MTYLKTQHLVTVLNTKCYQQQQQRTVSQQTVNRENCLNLTEMFVAVPARHIVSIDSGASW